MLYITMHCGGLTITHLDISAWVESWWALIVRRISFRTGIIRTRILGPTRGHKIHSVIRLFTRNSIKLLS